MVAVRTKALPAPWPSRAAGSGIRISYRDVPNYRIAGYASVFRNVDSYGEIVEPGAFAKSIAGLAGNVPVFYGHNLWKGFSEAGKPIGRTTTLVETEYGLYYEAEVAPTREGLDVLNLVAAQAITSSSFSFRVVSEELREGVKHLTELELIEVSPVVWGANPLATAYVLPVGEPKSAATHVFLQEVERFAEGVRLGG